MRFDHSAGFVELDEKALSEEADFYKLTGYAATFHDVDRVNDAIQPGAFKKCLDRMASKGESLQLYLNHDLMVPIGSIESVVEDRKGLKYVAHMPKDDTLVSGRVVPQIKRRSLKANSFGYKVRASDRRKSDNVRLLREIDIYEISVVGMPANPAAVIEHCKGVVPFQDDLAVDVRAKNWDAEAAMRRLLTHFGGENGDRPDADLKRAFLFVDESKAASEWDARMLIADVDDNGGLYINPIALYKCVASVIGGRGGSKLPEEAEESVKAHIERYYEKLSLESPFKSLSVVEYEALDTGEREARLRGLGLSRSLAKKLLTTGNSSGQRDADRPQDQRDAGPSNKEFSELLTTMKQFTVAAINMHKG